MPLGSGMFFIRRVITPKITSAAKAQKSSRPPNVAPGSTLSSLNGAFIGGLTGSMLWFVTKYSRDYQALFTYDSVLRKKTLVAGARIAPFTDYEGCALWLLVYFAIIAAVWAVLLYGSFSRGSRSLYLMRFLPMCCGHRSGIWCTALCCARCCWAFIISSGGS